EIGERGDRIGAVRFGGPDAVIAKLFGALHQPHRNLEMRARVADGKPKFHGVLLPRSGGGLGRGCPPLRNSPSLPSRAAREREYCAPRIIHSSVSRVGSAGPVLVSAHPK